MEKRNNGDTRVSVNLIDDDSGPTKRIPCHHFRSKDDLLSSVFEHQRGLSLKCVNAWSNDLFGEAAALLDSLFADLAAWASQPRRAGAGFTRIVMERAELPGHPARTIARHHKSEVEASLAHQLAARELADAVGKTRQIMLLLEE